MKLKNKIKNKVINYIKKGNWFNNILFPGCQKFWQYNTFNTDVINLGSTSATNAFCYEGLSIKGANFALCANPLLGDLEILKNYISYLKPNGCVIIPLCPFSSLAGSYTTFDDRYYTIIYPSSIPNFSFRNQQKVKDMVAHPHYYYPLYYIIRDILLRFKRKRSVLRNEEWMVQDADNWIKNWMFEFSINSFSDPLSLKNKDGIKDAILILNDIISFCYERNVRPALVIPPVYHTLSKKLTSDIRKLIIEPLLEGLNNKDVCVRDYIDDLDFTNDLSLFQNSFLLNKKGAKLYTKKVLKDLSLL